MRIVLCVLALGCAGAIVAGEQQALKPINRAAFPEEKRCSDYFFVNTFGGTVPEQIIFAYQAADGSTKRDSVPMKRAAVRISGDLTYEKVTMDDGLSGAIFRLSNAEYTKASECLPQPGAGGPLSASITR
jgi:hypothetical protein